MAEAVPFSHTKISTHSTHQPFTCWFRLWCDCDMMVNGDPMSASTIYSEHGRLRLEAQGSVRSSLVSMLRRIRVPLRIIPSELYSPLPMAPLLADCHHPVGYLVWKFISLEDMIMSSRTVAARSASRVLEANGEARPETNSQFQPEIPVSRPAARHLGKTGVSIRNLSEGAEVKEGQFKRQMRRGGTGCANQGL